MKLRPLGEVGWLCLDRMQRTTSLVPRLIIGMVIAADAMGAEVLTAEVDEFAADLDRCKIEKVPVSLHMCLPKRAMQPKHRILKDIVGLLPALEAGAAMKHSASEDEEAIAGMVDEKIPGPRVAPTEGIHEILKVLIAGRLGGCGHGADRLPLRGGRVTRNAGPPQIRHAGTGPVTGHHKREQRGRCWQRPTHCEYEDSRPPDWRLLELHMEPKF